MTILGIWIRFAFPPSIPGKRHFKGPRKGELSGNPKGKNPSDVWEFPNVKSNHPEKTIHPCQFPVELVERLVLSMTDENDDVLDPYVGVGSSVVAALKHKRNGYGCDIVEEYISVARDANIRLAGGSPQNTADGQTRLQSDASQWRTLMRIAAQVLSLKWMGIYARAPQRTVGTKSWTSVARVDAEACRTKISKEKTMPRQIALLAEGYERQIQG